MKKVKQFLFVFFVFVSVFCCSCGSVFASNGASWTAPSNYKMLNNATGSIGPLQTSKLSAPGRSFMRDWVANSSKYFVFIRNEDICFVKIPSPLNLTPAQYSTDGALDFIDCNHESVSFNVITGAPSAPFPNYGSYANGSYYICTSIYVQWKNLVASGAPKSRLPFIWKPVFDSPNGDFSVNLDDGLLDTPPPASSEPTKPSTSSEPEVVIPPYNPTIPNIGATDNEYVPYDATSWNGFLSYVLKSIGSSTNIGLLILAIIVGIYVVISIVKRFSK